MSSSSPRPYHVAKFGGSSVATAERIQRVVRLMQAAPAEAQHVVVVSALGGVTDQLLAAIDEALARSGRHPGLVESLERRHRDVLEAVADPAEHSALAEGLQRCLRELGELLDGISLLRECTLRSRDAIIGMGERLSAPLVAAAFRAAGTPAQAFEATQFVRTDDTFGEANVDFATTNELVQAFFAGQPADQVSIVTGFIATTARGVTTTLGRSGSDYTATLLGGALEAQQVIIWTDVDGVLSSDPRVVADAYTLPHLSYREAAELAYFGAKVLHPRTMRPLLERSIPLFIKNTLNPEADGTLISAETTEVESTVKAVTAIRGVALVQLEGAGMVGVPGISARAFGALAGRAINVLLISQASSEQSICIAVRAEEGTSAVEALHQAFERELSLGYIQRIYQGRDLAILSVVGDRMRMRPGLAGRMFATLGRNHINVLAIAEGAADTNISAVIREADAPQALRALHEALPVGRTRAHVFVLGAGLIGAELLDQLAAQAPTLLADEGLNLRLVGVANSRRWTWAPDGMDPATALDALAGGESVPPLADLAQHLIDSRLERLIVVDATASDAVPTLYAPLLEQGIAVVTPNKRGNTGPLVAYQQLRALARKRHTAYLFETTVGAGLPIMTTLRDLRLTGDRVHRIEGVLSGTLSYVFNELAQGRPFSAIVREAQAQGFTEPDPRDDLSGEDVARKALILARKIGLEVERADVEVASLVPPALADLSTEAFLESLPDHDASWAARVQGAAAHGRRLCYVAQVAEGSLTVGVQEVDAASPFGTLQGTDNLVRLTTDRYRDRPLVIQGPGAGPAVTAAGVLADVLRAAQ
ncbi:MAG: bifunctional aspartate kinase/homoserine dehydrogenase I [Bacteroidota bacterium]